MSAELALGAASTIAKAASLRYTVASERSAKKSLELKAKQNDLQASQRSVDALTRLNQTMAAQEAVSTVRGIGAGSLSSGASALGVSRYTSQELQNIETERLIEATNIESERRNVKRKLIAQIFGFAANTANSAASVYGSMPKGK